MKKQHTPIQLFKFGEMLGSLMKINQYLVSFNYDIKYRYKIENLIQYMADMVYEKQN